MKTSIDIMVAKAVARLDKALELDVNKHLNEMCTHVYEKESNNSKDDVVRSQVNRSFCKQNYLVDTVDCKSGTIIPSISNPLNPVSPLSIWQTSCVGSETKSSNLHENGLDDYSYSSVDECDSSYWD